MYIIAGILTTLALDIYYACYITIRTTQYTLNNAYSLYVGFFTIYNN
jgi:hypothetical protein